MELMELMEYAYENTEHYRKTLDGLGLKPGDIRSAEDLKKLPVLTREELQRDPESFVPAEYTKFPKINLIQLRRSYRPDGVYLKTYWDAEDDERAQAPLWHLREAWYGVDRTMRRVAFHTNIYRGNKIFEPKEEWLTDGGKTLSFLLTGLTEKTLKFRYVKLLEFNPDWLALTPSIAAILSKYLVSSGAPLPTHLKYVEISGQSDMGRLEEIFQVPCAGVFESEAVGPIAISGKDGRLRVLEESVFLEKSASGRLLATGLVNRAMPVFRLDLGYYGAISRTKKSAVLMITGPRDDMEIKLDGGQHRSCRELAAAVEYINEFMGCPVKQFLFRQTADGSFLVLFSLKPAFLGWKRTVEQEIRQKLKRLGWNERDWQVSFTEDSGLAPIACKTYFEGVAGHE